MSELGRHERRTFRKRKNQVNSCVEKEGKGLVQLDCMLGGRTVDEVREVKHRRAFYFFNPE